MSNVEFIKPTSLQDACEALMKPDYLAIAGGSDLIVKMRNGMYPNLKGLVDISGLPPLNTIRTDENAVIIGSGCTMNQIAKDQLIKDYFPALAKAASTVGALQIRNSATIGGNVANASPAGDTIPALFTLVADIMIIGCNGRRQIPIVEFFLSPGKTKLAPGEIIEGFKLLLRKTRGEFLKLGERRAHAISKINMAVSTWNDGKNHYRIAMGSVAPTVLRCREAEEYLESSEQLDDNTIARAAEIVSETAKPISDLRSTKAYRKQMAGVLLKRALQNLR
ncbi:MAG: xanthine dehydrogenase family protein subunit M [Candidatus Riflebacteria bacterium]|nr:xanthine dehydrogenase family protein subunit M [Candidatus Riflebacteria bacterium]